MFRLRLPLRILNLPPRALTPACRFCPPGVPQEWAQGPCLCRRTPSPRVSSTRSIRTASATRHRLPSASSLFCGVHVSPPGTRRFAASRGPPASLSPALHRSQRPRSRTALGFDCSNRYCGLHRRGPDQGPQPGTTRLRLCVPGAPPSWPLNTQRCSDRRRRLAQPIVGSELQLPSDPARLQTPEGCAVGSFCI